jgi:hypothetical protein
MNAHEESLLETVRLAYRARNHECYVCDLPAEFEVYSKGSARPTARGRIARFGRMLTVHLAGEQTGTVAIALAAMHDHAQHESIDEFIVRPTEHSIAAYAALEWYPAAVRSNDSSWVIDVSSPPARTNTVPQFPLEQTALAQYYAEKNGSCWTQSVSTKNTLSYKCGADTLTVDFAVHRFFRTPLQGTLTYWPEEAFLRLRCTPTKTAEEAAAVYMMLRSAYLLNPNTEATTHTEFHVG